MILEDDMFKDMYILCFFFTGSWSFSRLHMGEGKTPLNESPAGHYVSV